MRPISTLQWPICVVKNVLLIGTFILQGVSKTLTAGECHALHIHAMMSDIWTQNTESVAAATGKPLFSVSVSDIGLKPAEVEHNLELLFELAATWRAVMLL